MGEILTQDRAKEYDLAYRLVGRFMFHWALLENSLNDGIEKLFGMDSLEATIVTANIQFRSKIHVLKAFIDLKCDTNKWRELALTDLERIGTVNDQWRNTIAHVAFGPSEGGVKFLKIRARGKLNFVSPVWTETDFDNMRTEIIALTQRVDEIVKALIPKKPLTIADLVTLAGVSTPEPGLQNHLSRPIPGSPGSPKPKRGKTRETQPAPRKK